LISATRGQEHWVTVPVDLAYPSLDFHAAHESAYTFRRDNTPVEFVNFRLKATARASRPEIRNLDVADRSAEDAAKGAAPRQSQRGGLL
jgi:hypothetical protein